MIVILVHSNPGRGPAGSVCLNCRNHSIPAVGLASVSDNRGVGLKGWLAGPADKSVQRKNEPVVKPLSADLDRHRIAVLPLVNISPNPADEYFADGLTEEFISSVSKI